MKTKPYYKAVPITEELLKKLRQEFNFIGNEIITGNGALRIIENCIDESPIPSLGYKNDSELRKAFQKETNVDVFNSKGEFNTEYIGWLEQKCLDSQSPIHSSGTANEIALQNYPIDIVGEVKTADGKDQVVELIRHRIEAEYRKHKELDWAKIAALKIASELGEPEYVTPSQ